MPKAELNREDREKIKALNKMAPCQEKIIMTLSLMYSVAHQFSSS